MKISIYLRADKFKLYLLVEGGLGEKLAKNHELFFYIGDL